MRLEYTSKDGTSKRASVLFECIIGFILMTTAISMIILGGLLLVLLAEATRMLIHMVGKG